MAKTGGERKRRRAPNKKEKLGELSGKPGELPGKLGELPGKLGQVIVDYRDLGSTHWGKPDKVHCIEICWAFLDHPPKDIKELTNSEVDTRRP